MSHLKRLIHEIHRRSIWQVLGIYLLGGWIALQVVETLVDSLGLPDWFPAFAVMLLIVGLPIVMATAFVQEGVRGGSSVPSPGVPSPESNAAPDTTGTSDAAPSPADHAEDAQPSPNVAAGTGSLDRPSTRPPALYRLLTWRNAIVGGVVAFAFWGVIAAGWMGMNAVLDRQTGSVASNEEEGPGPGAAGADERLAGADLLKSIAVLPFSNLSTDQENAFFADGIHEDVLTQLSKVGDLVVISRTSVLAYRDTERPLAEIGQELGVGTIVEGSVRRSGDNVRITAQLIDAESDRHLWADNFDRALTAANVFSIQTEIAQRIVQALQATLSPEEESRLVRAPTEDLAAYEATLRGREAYRLYTDAANDEAIRLFKLAIENDPVYAEPRAGLADAYAQRVLRFGYGLEWADSAVAVAESALALDRELATAYKALGTGLSAQGQFGAALEANQEAIALDPNYADPHNNAGVALQRIGRLAEAHRLMRRSYRLQPNLAFARSNVAVSYGQLGDFDLSLQRLEEALRFEPNDIDALAYQTWVLSYSGRGEEAAEVAEELAALGPDNAYVQSWAAQAMLYGGRWDEALEMARKSLELSPDQDNLGPRHPGLIVGFVLRESDRLAEGDDALDAIHARRLVQLEANPTLGNAYYEIALVHAVRGEVDDAVDWFLRAEEVGWLDPFSIEHDPMVDPLRDDPRFDDLLRRQKVAVERQRQEIEAEETEAALR